MGTRRGVGQGGGGGGGRQLELKTSAIPAATVPFAS